jgi:hypothetical protein
MCGRVIQSSGPLRYAIVDGMNVRDTRLHNYPPRAVPLFGCQPLTQGRLLHSGVEKTTADE